MPDNKAAWIESKKAKPFVVKEAPYHAPGKDELVIKNFAVAINPVDVTMQNYAIIDVPYPNILGQDVAGKVEEVGSGVRDFKKGDRVIAYVSLSTTQHESQHRSSCPVFCPRTDALRKLPPENPSREDSSCTRQFTNQWLRNCQKISSSSGALSYLSVSCPPRMGSSISPDST
jgi:threonine dehydrogenase-like Zn-dependent dehydrogenase